MPFSNFHSNLIDVVYRKEPGQRKVDEKGEVLRYQVNQASHIRASFTCSASTRVESTQVISVPVNRGEHL